LPRPRQDRAGWTPAVRCQHDQAVRGVPL